MKFLYDLFPLLLFFAAYKLYDIYTATAVLIAASVTQVAWSWLRHRKVERMPLIAAGLIIVFGGATLIFQDEIFVKWKPTAVNWLFGLAFLASQFLGAKTLVERMLGESLQLPAPIWQRLNLVWIMFFFAMGAVNLWVAFNFDTDTWAEFKVFGMLGLTLVFVIAQGFYLARHLQLDTQTKD